MASLAALLGRLVTFKVSDWGGDSSSDMSTEQRRPAPLRESDVASSLVKDGVYDIQPGGALTPKPHMHIIAIDVDHQAHLVESTTPGHYHLYVEIPPVSGDAYAEWLRASAKIGLVSEGYAEVSIKRGHSDLRLPWVVKTAQPQQPVQPPSFQGLPIPVQPEPAPDPF